VRDVKKPQRGQRRGNTVSRAAGRVRAYLSVSGSGAGVGGCWGLLAAVSGATGAGFIVSRAARQKGVGEGLRKKARTRGRSFTSVREQ
jgi:hypothetical protein